MGDKTLLDDFFDQLVQGDVTAALDYLAPDAVVWHCHDRLEQDRATAAREWTAFVANCPYRAFKDVRTQATTNGFLRQHVMIIGTPDGTRRAMDVCVVAEVGTGGIVRIDEYLDRGSSYTPAD